MAIEEKETLRKYNNLYLEVIMRYKNYIEEQETLYASELPKLVTPENDAVIGIAGIIKGSFEEYSYERDFYDAIKLAYEYINEDITRVRMPIQFWLTPEQTIKSGAGDLLDKAALLCSILIALGNMSTTIIATVGDTTRKFIVFAEFGGRVIGIDIDKGLEEYSNKDELLKRLQGSTSEDTVTYEFNDKRYSDLV